MKNRKTLVLLTLMMILVNILVPFGAVFAAQLNLISGMTLTRDGTAGTDTDTTGVLMNKMTDSDLTTFNTFDQQSIGKRVVITLPNAMTVNSLEFDGLANSTVTTTVEYKDINGSRIVFDSTGVSSWAANTRQTKTLTKTVNNVKTIHINFSSTATTWNLKMYDMKLFGETTINHDEISSLVTSVNGNSAVLTYGIPSNNTYYTGSKIYRDGVLIATQTALDSSYQDTGLAWNTTYSYKVTALYSDGFETAGVNGAVVTGSQPADPTTIPPGNVIGLVASDLTYDSVNLTWSLPSDTDLDKVKIYKNDILIDTIPKTTNYVLSGLTPSTQYKVSVSLVDIDGNESPKSDINFTTAEGPDLAAPDIPSGLQVTKGDSALFVQWNEVKTADDLAGYNIYVDGVKYNTTLYKNNFISIPDLNNDQTYSIQVSSVDTTGNESSLSTAKTGTPVAGAMPIVKTKYNLSDVAYGVSEWFKSYWLIIAFSAAIPLSFYIASRIKLMFIE